MVMDGEQGAVDFPSCRRAATGPGEASHGVHGSARAFPARCGLVSLACTRAFRPVAVRLPMFPARCRSVNEANLPGSVRLAFYYSRIPSEAGLRAGVVAHREFGSSDSRRAIR